MSPVRALVVGWSSFRHGEATAGDVLSMDAVSQALTAAGVDAEIAWSAVMCPPGGLRLDDADPDRFSHLVFACGPLVGPSIPQLHQRFSHCARIAVGVSVPDPKDPAVTGFHHVVPRDAAGAPTRVDLAAAPRSAGVPVLGVTLASAQPEYGTRQRHDRVTAAITDWLPTTGAAVLPLDTRLDPRDWRLAARPEQFEAIVRRLDVMVTTRLHGLVLALKAGVPAVAVDPVEGGGKVAAQAAAWQWPAFLLPHELTADRLDELVAWCRSDAGRTAAHAMAAGAPRAAAVSLDAVLALVVPAGLHG
ncbi:polysaccharide pyruvyl transferase family protein [Nakamurella leprariae]|uniref:polysaccharide pyruvyl transferase family protein n=1 Tax=Nakamurella leprariae TaxID=2803911 RepID=UPI002E2BBF85|nr:polysaccharide pyruvyl transferase family protein [Nakamurella leprariae]